MDIKKMEMWRKLLIEQEFNEKNIDKILDYIENHSEYETLNGRLEKSTLHLVLKLFKELDLDKIEFVKISDKIRTNVLSFNFTNVWDVPVAGFEMIFIDEAKKMFDKILKTKKLYIFLVFSEIIVDETTLVFNRFYIE